MPAFHRLVGTERVRARRTGGETGAGGAPGAFEPGACAGHRRRMRRDGAVGLGDDVRGGSRTAKCAKNLAFDYQDRFGLLSRLLE